MAEKTGYFGETGKYELGWWNHKWRGPITAQGNSRLTRHTTNDSQYNYYTANAPTLTLDADEYPVSVQFMSYNGSGWYCSQDDYDSQNPGRATAYLCYSSGATNYETRKITDLAIDRGASTKPTRAYQIANGRALAGKALQIYVTGNRGIWFDGQCEVKVTTLKHAITWTDPGIAVSQNEYELTVTMSGEASDSWGDEVSYRLYVDGIDKGAFNGNTKTITLTDDQLEIPHTFTVAAVSTISQDGAVETFTPKSVHKTVKYYTGSGFAEAIVHCHDGNGFVEVEPYYFDGNDWVLCSQT